MEVINYIVSKLVCILFRELITYLYRGYNPVTKYHGHPSIQAALVLPRTLHVSGLAPVHRRSTPALAVAARVC